MIGDRQVTLLDTPGHADFSAEMERTLQVLDYAVLVISGADGVQGQVRTLWTLLDRYEIPVFLFVNKMDQPGTDRAALLQELKEELDERCVDFGKDQDREELLENIAVCEESLLEHYLETGEIEDEAVRTLIRERKLFPCCFGSALKMQGVEEFLQVFDTYTTAPSYPDDFGAKVYKIARDPSGTRLTYLKITGGTLKVKGRFKGEKQAEPGRNLGGKGPSDPDLFRCFLSGGGRGFPRDGLCCSGAGFQLVRRRTGNGGGRPGANAGAGALLSDSFSGRGGRPPDASETPAAGGGSTGTAHHLERTGGRDPCPGHGRGPDRNFKKHDCRAVRRPRRIWLRKYCI